MKKLLVASLLMSGLASANGKTVISGNYDGKFVVIMDYMVRDPSKMIQVPVVDGKFRYEMPSDTLKVYTIQSDKNLGSYRMNFFFSEPVELTVCFTPDIDVATGRDMGYVAEVVSPEGSMSRRITDLKKRITERIENEPCYKVRDSLETAGKYYSPELMALMKRVNANPELMNDSLEAVINKYYDTDTWRTPEAKAAEERLEQWYRQGGPQKIERGFIVEDNSLAGLFMLAMNSIHAEDTYPYKLNSSKKQNTDSSSCPPRNGIVGHKFHIKNMAQKQNTAHTENNAYVKSPTQRQVGKGRNTVKCKVQHLAQIKF